MWEEILPHYHMSVFERLDTTKALLSSITLSIRPPYCQTTFMGLLFILQDRTRYLLL
jgi:hypothetical protein